MIPIPLPVLKDLANTYRHSGILALSFADGKFAVSSYGMTRTKCDAIKLVNERIAELIEQGVIEIPEELR